MKPPRLYKSRKVQSEQGVTSDQVDVVESNINVQEVSKKVKVKHSKTHREYWRHRVFKNTYTENGKTCCTTDLNMKVSFKKVRRTINLGTPNAMTAAERAATYWRNLVSGGWAHANSQLNPGTEEKKDEVVTIGKLIAVSRKFSTVRTESFNEYAKALRKLASDILNIKADGKFDAKQGASEWRNRVDSTPLEKLTPNAVVAWKNNRLTSAPGVQERNSAAVTINSILRGSKSLVNKRIIRFIKEELDLPSPLWFEGVPMEPEPSLRYQSRIDASSLLTRAKDELVESQPEIFKAVMLTLMFGLRRSEADTLLWSQVQLKGKRPEISIHDTEVKRLKSKDSAGNLPIEKEMIPYFERFQREATSKFVLETPARSRIKEGVRSSRGYRCDATFNRLITWLRLHGVPGKRPIHTLRKEIGSIIATRDGIYKASRYLRHGNISITDKIYAAVKEPIITGLGSLFG